MKNLDQKLRANCDTKLENFQLKVTVDSRFIWCTSKFDHRTVSDTNKSSIKPDNFKQGTNKISSWEILNSSYVPKKTIQNIEKVIGKKILTVFNSTEKNKIKSEKTPTQEISFNFWNKKKILITNIWICCFYIWWNFCEIENSVNFFVSFLWELMEF